MNKIYGLAWNVTQGRGVAPRKKTRMPGKPASRVGTAVAAACLALGAANAAAQTVVSTSTTTRMTLGAGQSGTVSSTGTIDTRGVGYGVWVSTGQTSASIVNNGNIYGEERGINTADGSVSGNITNTGTITANGHAMSISAVSGNVTNSGTIDGYNAAWGDTSGIYMSGTVGGNVVNQSAGSIHGAKYGIYLNGTTVVANGITNSGTISGGTKSIFADAGSNLGSITIAGNDTARFIGAVDAANTPLTVAAGAVFTLNNGNSFTVQSFTNAGTLKTAAGGTATVTGNFANTGTFSPLVSGMTTYGKLNVTGTATLGGALHVVSSGASGLTAGSLNGIISAGAVNGTFASYDDDSVLFDFTPVYTATRVDLTVAASSNTAYRAAVLSGNKPGVGAARTLDQIFGNDPTGPISTLFQGITGGNAAVSDAVSQTLPLLTTGTTSASQGTMTGIGRIVQARQESNRGMSSGDDFYGDRNFWMKPFGSWADQDDRDGVSGYSARTAGLAIGADATVSAHSRVGLALAYANASVTGNSTVAPNSAKVDLYQLIGYGSYALDADTEVTYQADIGTNKNHGRRDIRFAGTTANSNYNSLTAHAGIGVGRTYALNAQTSVTPVLRVDYTTIRDRAYAETGAGALNLNVNANTTNELVYSAEAKVAHKLDDETTLLGSLGAGYDARAKASSVTAAYAGSPSLAFTTTGAKPDSWSLRGGLGVASKLKNGPEITARYDVEHRTGFNNQTVSAKLRWAF